MKKDSVFANGLKGVISAIESGAGVENNLIETAIGETEINGTLYQIQISFVKRELFIHPDVVSASFVVRNDVKLN